MRGFIHLTAIAFLATRGFAKKPVAKALTSTTEPETYVPYEIYSVDFCRDRAQEWYLNGGDWKWITEGCKLRADNSSYNMAWLGRRDPISLQWEDYKCTLDLSWKSEEDGSRSMMMYAQAQDSSFEYLNGYECGIYRTDGVDYLKMYTVGKKSSIELASTEVEFSLEGVKVLEMEVYSMWKNCYFTSNGTSYSISATDTTYSEGSVGVKTSTAETTFKDIACYELGTLAPSLSPMPTHHPTPLPTIADPTFNPTFNPTFRPTSYPSTPPTTGPTPYPSPLPTTPPTHAPTTGPTPYPSTLPTPAPTTGPTPYPSTTPTPLPSIPPTTGPSPYPSVTPTPMPSLKPSFYPTAFPSHPPSASPTIEPSYFPTTLPTVTPSALPTASPSRVPTSLPTWTPTIGPTPYPSPVPTEAPFPAPSASPIATPSSPPTNPPSGAPSEGPSLVPTIGPTPYPSATPSIMPTREPSIMPTAAPSFIPTTGPTPYPSPVPTPSPTHKPVFEPTPNPTSFPTIPPSHLPTPVPTYIPTHAPSSDSGATTVSAFGTADIGLAVMGVVLLVACCICCLAGIGYNSKKKKREAQNALAWDQISDSLGENEDGSLAEPYERESESEVNPIQSGENESSLESLWPSSLFAPSSSQPASGAYQAAPTHGEEDEDGASMWPGAIKKDKKKDEPSMWPGSGGEDQAVEAEVSFFDSLWPTSGTDKDAYGASTDANGEVWSFDGDAALSGDAGAETIAPVVAEAHEEDAEEFHF